MKAIKHIRTCTGETRNSAAPSLPLASPKPTPSNTGELWDFIRVIKVIRGIMGT